MGNKSFLQRLKKIDPEILNYVNPSDTQRLIRAYEVKLFTKKTLFEWFKSTKSVFEDKNFYKIYIDYPRDILVNKIRNRAQDMINKGAILEVKKFLKMKVSKKRTAAKAIGLIEIKDFIDKKIEIGSFGIGNVFNIVEVIIPNVPSDPINRFFKSNPILFFFNGFIVETI